MRGLITGILGVSSLLFGYLLLYAERTTCDFGQCTTETVVSPEAMFFVPVGWVLLGLVVVWNTRNE